MISFHLCTDSNCQSCKYVQCPLLFNGLGVNKFGKLIKEHGCGILLEVYSSIKIRIPFYLKVCLFNWIILRRIAWYPKATIPPVVMVFTVNVFLLKDVSNARLTSLPPWLQNKASHHVILLAISLTRIIVLRMMLWVHMYHQWSPSHAFGSVAGRWKECAIDWC